MSAQLPPPVRSLLEVSGSHHIYPSLRPAPGDHLRSVPRGGQEGLVSERRRRRHAGSIGRPSPEEEEDPKDADRSGGRVRRLLVPSKLLRGAAVEQGDPGEQCPVLHLPLAGHELDLL